MIKAILIDDEKNAITALRLALEAYCPDVKIVGTAQSATEGIREIRSNDPEVVFLDIQMPHMSGIELLEALGADRNFDLIFVTAFDEFAIKAFRLSAIDYLLKPIGVTELKEAVKKVIDRRGVLETVPVRAAKLREALKGKLAIPGKRGNEYVELSDIIRIEAEGSYSFIHFTNRRPLLVSKNLKEFQSSLEADTFFRVHKSHMINLRFIKEYSPSKDGGQLKMIDDSLVEISRIRKAELVAILNDHFHQ